MKRILYLLVFVSLFIYQAEAGNPDRQGEAGAYELLMNPWAGSAGLHTMNTSSISGVDALRLNVAGLVRIKKTEIELGYSQYLLGADVAMNAFGFGQKLGKNSAFGVTIMALNFGDIPVTTTDQPEGTGATFSPGFFNLGIGYSHIFENKISVGVTFRVVSESIADAKASSFAIDAGVQYVTGKDDNFKLGISLRNIGAPMKFSGEGLSIQKPFPVGAENYESAVNLRPKRYELPSVLNMGLSYDFLFGGKSKITVIGNFTSNAFSQDQIGGGLEYGFKNMFFLRGGYKYEFGSQSDNGKVAPVYTGIAGGATIEVPFNKNDANSGRLGIDYAYRTTKIWSGTHNIAIRIIL